MTTRPDFARLYHFLAGELSAKEREEIEAWLAADPERAALLAEVQRFRDEAGPAIAARESGLSIDVNAALDRFLAARRSRRRLDRRARGFPARPAASVALKIAAALGLVVGGTLLYRSQSLSTRTDAPAEMGMREYVTPRGQRADFRLVDGTRVILSVASRLRVPRDYGLRSRDLYLEGEGYFDVTHDPARPFIVRTKTAAAHDLGTRFAVRAYPADSMVQVVVAEGRVAVASRVLAAGQTARVGPAGDVAMRDGVDVERLLSWTAGRLTFDNTPLREAAVELGRWYDLDIRLGDAMIADRRFTAAFGGESVPEVLRLLAASLDLRVERRGGTVVLRAR